MTFVCVSNPVPTTLKEKKRRGAYKGKSGTVSQKVDFCKKSLTKIRDIKDLSAEAITLTEKIYDFIKGNNF